MSGENAQKLASSGFVEGFWMKHGDLAEDSVDPTTSSYMINIIIAQFFALIG